MAKRAGLPLVIAGIVQDQDYFEAGGGAPGRRRPGQLPGPGRPRAASRGLLGGARALLHLISFEEPFGFSVVEAMACGTPVIAYPTGLDARDHHRR